MSDYMPFASVLRQNYVDYLLHLDHGGERFRFEEKREEHPGLVHCSALMDCPLKASKERSQTEAVFPEFLKQNNPSVLHRMQLGVRSAEAFQESLIYRNSIDMTWHGECEVSVASQGLMIQGRCDGIIKEWNGFDDPLHIIEIKHRLATYKDKFPQPRMGDVFQMLAYKEIMQADEANLIILNTPAYKDFNDPNAMMEIWALVEDGEGYKLVSEHGYDWQHPQNNGTFINVREMREEITRQLTYLDGETTPPIDLVDREHSWQCASVKLYPKESRPGVLIPVCPYWCHSSREQAEHGMQYTHQEVLYDF